MDVQTASTEFGTTVRSATGASPVGRLFLVADRMKAVLVGTAGIGGHCDECLGELALSIRAKIRAKIPLKILADVMHAFPTSARSWSRRCASSLKAQHDQSKLMSISG